MRKYPIPTKPKLPHWVGPDDDGSIDCPRCEENEEGGPCGWHDDSAPSPMEDADKLAEED